MDSISLKISFSLAACRIWGIERTVCDWSLRLGPVSVIAEGIRRRSLFRVPEVCRLRSRRRWMEGDNCDTIEGGRDEQCGE